MLSAHHTTATQRLLAAGDIDVRWSAQEELRPDRVVRLPAAEPGSPSVVVKVATSDGDGQDSRWALHNEWAALSMFDRLVTAATPRLLAADLAAGVLVLEDLGDGPSLATLLLGDDPVVAAGAAERSAASLGALHAATIGRADDFTALRRQADPAYEPLAHRRELRGMPMAERIAELPDLLSAHGLPGLTSTASAELDGVLATLSEPQVFLVLSNGDPCPDNERVGPAGSRFFDFEAAGYHHALVDAAHYRIPFPNCWCWRRMPAEVTQRMESAYRASLGTACPAALDDTTYEPALAQMTAAWLVWTLHRRLPDAATNELFRQRIMSSLTGLTTNHVAGTALPGITQWGDETVAVLSQRWPQTTLPAPTYPAFGGPPFAA